MCGLVVFLDNSRIDNPDTAMQAALRSISHRGKPGRQGSWTDGYVTLGHVRLPIRGLGKEYDQPMHGRNWVGLFVGESFTTNGPNDSLEMLTEFYEHMNDVRYLTKHDGFWAMVLHDRRAGLTHVLVDHLSIKPLYFDTASGVISTELRPLVAVDPHPALDFHYLSNVRKWGYDPSFRTPYESIRRLKPGCCYTFQGTRPIRVQEYFPLTPNPTLDPKECIEEAVKRRMLSDVPIAVLCSGGLDSTIVTQLALKYRDDLTVYHIQNQEDTNYFCHIDFPTATEVRIIDINGCDDRLEEALDATEEPVDLGSVLPQFLLAHALKHDGFNVVLTGDGADELFGGYKRALDYDSQYSDVFSELVHYHLPRLDKVMMSATVELRSPFLAPRVVSSALALPWHRRTQKQVLKEAFRGIVPKSILERDKLPLKSQHVRFGGEKYRNWVVDRFIEDHNT